MTASLTLFSSSLPAQKNRKMVMKAKTVVIYQGPSMLDGKPIVVFASGLKESSTNSKTGGLIQTWILRSDIAPTEAVHTGDDASVCGDCPHRGDLVLQPDGTTRNANRSCYVTVFHAPRSIWESWQRGNVPAATPEEFEQIVAGRQLRWGAYGDPAAIPHNLVERLSRAAESVNGYTHQWRLGFALQEWLMASCDTPQDVQDARAMGWRSFFVDASEQGVKRLDSKTMHCPASEEMGKALTCDQCMACGGLSSGRKADVVQIRAHGSVARVQAARRRLPVLQPAA